MLYVWELNSDRLLSNTSVATQSMILEMSSYISNESTQNKIIVITANQTQKQNWSNIKNIKSDFFHKMICFDSAYVPILSLKLLTRIQIEYVYLKIKQS